MSAVSQMALMIKQTTAAQTIYSATLAVDSTGNENFSFRNLATGLSAGGNQVRVTFEAPSSGSCKVDRASIGVRASNADTTATPVELLFSGVSGFTISSGGILVSDWANLLFSGSDTLVVVVDISSTNGNLRVRSSGGDSDYEKAATASYNQATVSGFSLVANRTRTFNKIESRTI